MESVKSVFGGTEHSFFLVDDIGDVSNFHVSSIVNLLFQLPIHPVGATDLLKIPNFLTFNHLRRLYDSSNKVDLIGFVSPPFYYYIFFNFVEKLNLYFRPLAV